MSDMNKTMHYAIQVPGAQSCGIPYTYNDMQIEKMLVIRSRDF